MMISIAPLLLGVARPAATTTTPGASAAATARSATPFRHSAVRMQEFDPDMFAQYANPPSFDGTKLQIVEFPNPILRAANADIANFDDDFRALCKEMLSVMYGAKGVGLAAPQVGLNLRLFVYNPDPTAPGALRTMGERVVANPKIIEYCQRTDVEIEGCLSSRAECCRGDIRRCREIQVEYYDERGRLKKKKLRGFEARVFQHEYDHIEGVLHIDRQSPTDRKRSQPFLDVLVEQHGDGGVLEPPAEKLSALQPPPAFWEVAADAAAVEGAMQAIRSAASTKREANAAAETAKPKGSGFGGAVKSSKGKGGGGKAKKKRR